MTLGSPWLLLLLAPAAFVFWRKYFRPPTPPPAIPFPDSARLESLAPETSTRVLAALPGALLAAAALLMVLALARPQRLRVLPPAGQEGTDILLAIDTSGSMRALDFNPKDRMSAAKDAAREFIRHRSSDRIGIVVFSGTAQLQCPLTADYAALTDYLDLVEVGMLRTDGTAIGDGLATALNHLKDAPGKTKTVVLLTDGRNNAGEIDPLTAAQTAQSLGIKVYTIGTGAKGPALFPVDDPVFGRRLVRLPEDLDEAALIAIARSTGGEYFRATSMKELYAVYAEIDRLEKAPMKTPPRVQRIDLYAWLLAPALLLLAGEALLSQTWLLTLP